MRWEGSPSSRTPSSRMVPEVAGMSPETRFKSVVLPAPFGPMRPCTSPASTAREAPSTAARPPKVLRTSSSSSSMGLPPRPPPGAQAARQGGDALGQEEDDEQQHQAVHEEAKRAGLEPDPGADLAEHLGQQGEEGRADH